MKLRLLILRILELLEMYGWILYASIAQAQASSEADAWYLVKASRLGARKSGLSSVVEVASGCCLN